MKSILFCVALAAMAVGFSSSVLAEELSSAVVLQEIKTEELAKVDVSESVSEVPVRRAYRHAGVLVGEP